MASTNKTTNYELSQFIETDKPGWLTDYNGDMRKLDTALKGVSDVASGASGSLSSLTDRMTAAEGAITTNANDIDALEARADALEAQAQSQAGTISGIQTEQITQNAGIEAATELGYNLARPYDSASTYAVGAYVLFQNTLYKCVTAIATGEAFDPTKWLAIKATDEIAAGGYTLPIASASQLGGVKVGNHLSIDPVTGVLSASGGAAEVVRVIQQGGQGTMYGTPIDPNSGRDWELWSASGNTAFQYLSPSNFAINFGEYDYERITICKIGKLFAIMGEVSLTWALSNTIARSDRAYGTVRIPITPGTQGYNAIYNMLHGSTLIDAINAPLSGECGRNNEICRAIFSYNTTNDSCSLHLTFNKTFNIYNSSTSITWTGSKLTYIAMNYVE